MKNIKLVLLLLIVAAIVIIVLQNQSSWQVRFLWFTGEVPGIVLLFLTAAAGFFVGIVVTLLIKRGAKSRHRTGSEEELKIKS